MRQKLEPLGDGLDTAVAAPAEQGTFAIMGRIVMESLARAMPDSQSAVLFCLAWHAAVQVRMRRGPRAGQPTARVSATSLAAITGRPLRTVRYALSKLRARGAIVPENTQPGRTSVYRLPFHHRHAHGEAECPDVIGAEVRDA